MRFEEEAVTVNMIKGSLPNAIAAIVAAGGQITAGRFALRPMQLSDAGLCALYAGDRRVAEATRSIPHPLPPGAVEAFISRAMAAGMIGAAADGQEVIWAIDGAASGLPDLMGVNSLKPMGGAQSEIGYWVAPALWNTGIASQAVAALIGANPLGDRTIFAEVFQDNPGSARVLSNCGFQYLGDAETFSKARGARVPTWTYLRKLD